MNSKFVLIVLLVIVILILVNTYKQKIIETDCQNIRCSWKITNCCPENAGANWKCVDLNAFETPPCPNPKDIVCPQVISPKPTTNCMCEKGSCVVK